MRGGRMMRGKRKQVPLSLASSFFSLRLFLLWNLFIIFFYLLISRQFSFFNISKWMEGRGKEEKVERGGKEEGETKYR
jgi:hypothetical protein